MSEGKQTIAVKTRHPLCVGMDIDVAVTFRSTLLVSDIGGPNTGWNADEVTIDGDLYVFDGRDWRNSGDGHKASFDYAESIEAAVWLARRKADAL